MSYIEPALNFTCPLCEAPPAVRCRWESGTARFESHLERREVAKNHAFDHLMEDIARSGSDAA